MIFNDELIIKLKMKVILTLFILLIVKALAHQEYDESDPFQEYRQKYSDKSSQFSRVKKGWIEYIQTELFSCMIIKCKLFSLGVDIVSLEIICFFILAVYLLNFILGKRVNQKIADDWLDSVR